MKFSQYNKFWFIKLIYKILLHFTHWKSISYSKFQAFTWICWSITCLHIFKGWFFNILTISIEECTLCNIVYIAIVLTSVNFEFSNITLNHLTMFWPHDLIFLILNQICRFVPKSKWYHLLDRIIICDDSVHPQAFIK